MIYWDNLDDRLVYEVVRFLLLDIADDLDWDDLDDHLVFKMRSLILDYFDPPQ
jgi:hypothetical protein